MFFFFFKSKALPQDKSNFKIKFLFPEGKKKNNQPGLFSYQAFSIFRKKSKNIIKSKAVKKVKEKIE